MRDECKLCSHPNLNCGIMTPPKSERDLICTRGKGHSGPHAACGSSHPMLIWWDIYNECVNYMDRKHE